MKKGKKILLSIIFVFLLCIFVSYVVGFIKINSNNEQGIIVLAYHHFLPEKDKEKYWPENYEVMATEKFEEQMKYLKNNNYVSIKPEQIDCYLNKTCKVSKKAFIVTIDDGNISSYYEALPILEKYNIYSINFIISDRIWNKSEKLDNTDLSTFYYLDMDLLKDIKDNHKTMYIGSHSNSLHLFAENGEKLYTTKNYGELLSDAKKSKEILFDTDYMAYPFGSANNDYKKAIKEAGYSYAFSFQNNKKLTINSDRYFLPRIEIRGDETMSDFKDKLNGKVSIMKYTKGFMKKLLHI